MVPIFPGESADLYQATVQNGALRFAVNSDKTPPILRGKPPCLDFAIYILWHNTLKFRIMPHRRINPFTPP
jgi:hypothetical protein